MRVIPIIFVLLFGVTTAMSQDAAQKLRMLNQAIATKFSPRSLEQERDAQISMVSSPVKDEFETQSMFERRKADAKQKADRMRQEYNRRIADARVMFERRITELKTERDQLLASTRASVTSRVTVGTYNADSQTFPLTLAVSGATHPVTVPISIARDFKSASGNLEAQGEKQLTENETWEYFNFKVEYAGQTFRFGPTKGTMQISPGVATGLPPALNFYAQFKEPSGNKRLDAEEEGEIVIVIENTGRGAAIGVDVAARADVSEGLSFAPSVYVGEVGAGKSVTARLPLRGMQNLKDGTVSLTLTPKETYGFAPSPKIITFETRALIPPELYVVDFGVDDNSKDGRIDPGELATFTVRIGNRGRGTAKNVRADVRVGENVFFAGYSLQKFELGTLESGRHADITFTIYTNNLAKVLPIYVTATEDRGKFGFADYKLPVAFNQRIQTTEQITIAGTGESKAVPVIASGLSIDVDMNVPEGAAMNPDAIAVIIGIEQYKSIPPVTHAKRDAASFREYAVKVLGVPDAKTNIYHIVNDEATKGEFEKLFSSDGWVAKRVKPTTDVYVFYAGHGAPELNEKSAYLIPHEGDPNYLRQTGFPIKKITETLGALPARSVSVFLDACFSGGTRENKILLADARPVLIKVEDPVLLNERMTLFTASTGNQISSAYPDKKHGLFTYYLLKGLRGEADANRDKQVTARELGEYVREQVSQTAGMLDREQTPQVTGKNLDRVIAKLK